MSLSNMHPLPSALEERMPTMYVHQQEQYIGSVYMLKATWMLPGNVPYPVLRILLGNPTNSHLVWGDIEV